MLLNQSELAYCEYYISRILHYTRHYKQLNRNDQDPNFLQDKRFLQDMVACQMVLQMAYLVSRHFRPTNSPG